MRLMSGQGRMNEIICRCRKVAVSPPTHIGRDGYVRQKIHDFIAILNSVGHPDIFITMTCNPY